MLQKIPGKKRSTRNPLVSTQPEPETSQTRLRNYIFAVLAVLVALTISFTMRPIFAASPFIIFFGAISLIAWYVGFVPAVLASILSVIVGDFFFTEPVFQVSLSSDDAIRLVVFILIVYLMNLPNNRRKQSEEIIRQQREWFRVCLSGIGDAVIATDTDGCVVFMNPTAESLTGWTQGEALGKKVDDIFKIINESSRQPVTHPISVVLTEHRVVGLANHTVLITRDGGEKPIDDSGAPIRNSDGEVIGAVLVFRDIGDQRKAEAQLRESEARFRMMADTAPALIWMSGADKLCFYFNKPWLEFRGRTMEQESGNGWTEGLHPDDRDRCLNTYHTAFDARQPYQMEYRLQRGDGEYRWIVDHGVPRYATDATFLGYIGSCIEINELKEAQEEQNRLNKLLDEQRQRLRNVLANVPGVVWESWGEPDDQEQRIDFVSEYVEQMLGYTTDEWLNTPNFWLTIVHPDDREMAAATSRQTFTSQKPGVNRFRWIARDGRVIPVETRSTAIVDAGGKSIGMRGVTMDVSERESAERERMLLFHNQQVAVRQKEEAFAILDALFSSAPIGLAFFDRDVRFQRINRALAEINGLTPEAHIGYTPRELLPDVDVEGTQEMFLKVLETGQAVSFETSGSTPASVDERRYWLANYYPIRLEDELLGIGAVVIDVTDRKRMEQQRTELLEREREARAAAEEANRLKLTFLAMISHELRTPLTSIKGFATTLLADDITWDAESQRDFIAIISEESDKLTDLVEQLLDLSRLEAGTLGIMPEPISLNEIVGGAMAQLETITASHRLRIDMPSDLPRILADSRRIGQVLVNLVNNAAKYAPSESEIRIAIKLYDSFVRVSVSDQGPGISPEERPLVFEAFRQVGNSNSNTKKGAGLGLAICKGLVEAHAGAIWIEDSEIGTTIAFTVPVIG